MRRITIVILAALVLASWGCSRPQDGGVAVSQVFRYRLNEDPPTLDPVQAQDITSDAVLLKLFDGLVDLDPATLELVPAVAERWDISADGLTYTFHLRRGVRFHNGREVVADDAIYTILRGLDPEKRSGRPWVFTPIQGAASFRTGEADHVAGLHAPDSHTLVIRLEAPYSPFLSHLVTAQGGIVPREVYDDPEQRYLEHPVGCGPFRFGAWERGQSVTLEAFDDYYGEGPYIDRVLFKIIRDENTALEEYRAGNLELNDEIPSGMREQLRREFGDQYRRWPQIAVRAFALNHARPPFQGNRALRQAVNHAVDREFILRTLDEDKDYPVPGVVPPGLPAFDPELEGYDYDPEKARRLLLEAGHPNGEGLPELRILVNNNGGHERICERVVADLAAVGIRARTRSVDFGAFLEGLNGTVDEPPEDEILYFAWVADFPDAFNFLFPNLHSSNLGPGGNFARYVNPELDALLDRAVSETDPARRIQLYRRAERIAVEDAVWLFFYSYRDEALVRPEVRGLVLNPLGDFAIPLSRVRLEPPG